MELEMADLYIYISTVSGCLVPSENLPGCGLRLFCDMVFSEEPRKDVGYV